MLTYCKNCVYPVHAVNLDIDDEGVCSSCRTFQEIVKLNDSNWLKRNDKLIQILEESKKLLRAIMTVLFQLEVEKIVIFKPTILNLWVLNLY